MQQRTPPNTPQISVPCLKIVDNLPSPPHCAAQLLPLHVPLWFTSLLTEQTARPPLVCILETSLWISPPFLRGNFPELNPKMCHPWGNLLLKGRSLGMTRQASTKRGGNRLHLAV